ncbi:cytochrome P450 [Aspergillus avenaceus]|uniref:Cytochrome P450 n=1 Tax=Aspergillus avenaceus TaxID=36643 RepID=A0A5N6TZN2_ASPAV|nr:cytochrome P450 [Aspergillus avenaceus]
MLFSEMIATSGYYPLSGIVLLGALYITWNIIYNRHIHPLRHYPGPLSAAVSRIPYAKAYVQGKLHLYVQGLHNTYGDVVRVAPDQLSYRNGEAWKDIHSHGRNFTKDMRFYQESKTKAPSLVVASDGVHPRQKKAILRAFSDSALRDHERVLQPLVDKLIQRLRENCPDDNAKAVDMTHWYNYVMFDFMAQELFGKPLGCLDSGAYHPWVDMLFGSIKAWAFVSISKYFPSIAFIIKPIVLFCFRDLLRHRDTKLSSMSSQVPGRMESESTGAGFITYIQNNRDPKSTLLPEEVFPNMSFLMIAGSETTATLLSGCTFFMLQHREVYDKLVTEIRQEFSSTSEMTFASVGSLPYLRAVIQEALRMHPPVPLGMPRIVPDGGAVVSGRFVPGKTSVAVASWVAYRSPSNFTDPQKFLPERWLDNASEKRDDKTDAFQPFSLGPRGCPGKSLGYSEASLMLARLLWSFDLHLSEECHDWDDQSAYIVWEMKPLLVRLVSR